MRGSGGEVSNLRRAKDNAGIGIGYDCGQARERACELQAVRRITRYSDYSCIYRTEERRYEIQAWLIKQDATISWPHPSIRERSGDGAGATIQLLISKHVGLVFAVCEEGIGSTVLLM
jgi:hypothetical protein